MVDAHLVDPALHRIFAEQVPRMGQLAKIESLQRETFLLIRTYLEERRNEISVEDLDSATSICVTTVESLTHEFVSTSRARVMRSGNFCVRNASTSWL